MNGQPDIIEGWLQQHQAGRVEPVAPVAPIAGVDPIEGFIQSAPEIPETDYLETAAGVAELTGHLAYGAAAWMPSVLAGMGQIGVQKVANAVKLRAATDPALSPEVRQRAQESVKTPEQIREMVGESEMLIAGLAPEPRTELAREGLEKVGEFFDKLFTWTHTAEQHYAEQGYPNFGYAVSKMGELLFFKALHGIGSKVRTKGTDAVKGWRGRRLNKEAELDVQKAFDEIGISKKVLENPLEAENQKTIEKVFRREINQEKIDELFPSEAEAPIREAVRQDLAVLEAKEIVERPKVKEAEPVKEDLKVTPEETKALLRGQEKVEEIKEPSLEPVQFIGMQKAAGETFPIVEATTGKMKGGQIDFDPAKHKIINIAEYEKATAEPTSVQKPNIAEQFGEQVAGEVADGLKIAEDMGVFATVREMLEGKKKAGEILKEVKKGEYYKEDLKDFGYSEKDIRSSVRAIKVSEFGDTKAARDFQRRIGKETAEIKKIKEKEPEAGFERVDPETGRAPGVEADLTPYGKPRTLDDISAQVLVEQLPLRVSEGGDIIKSGALARHFAKSEGLEGTVTKVPDGEGWYVKKTKEARKAELENQKALYDEILNEAKMPEEIELEGGSSLFDTVLKTLTDEKGAITIGPKEVKTVKDLIESGKFTRDEVIKGLKTRGLSDKEISKLVPEQKKLRAETPEESKWLKKGQDPTEKLPGRVIKKYKDKEPRRAPGVTREDAHIVSTTSDLPSSRGAGLSRAPIGEKVRLFATSEGLFTQIGKSLREIFYRRIIKAQKKSSDYSIELIKESNKLKKTFRLGSRELHSERIAIYEIAQQKDGISRLRNQGITKIPKLTAKEKIVYDKFQELYKRLYVEVNRARKAVGQETFPPVENYSMWAHDMTKLSDMERISVFDKLEKVQAGLDRIRSIPSQIDKLGRAPGLGGHEKFRGGPDTPGYLVLDTFENFNTYAKLAARSIHEGEPIAYAHELLRKNFGLSDNAPHTYKFLSDWLDYQKGHEPIMFIENPKARRVMRTLSSNVATAYLTYAFRATIVQLASFNLSYAKLGEFYIATGMTKFLDPRQLKRAARESNVLTTRSPEEILIESQRMHPLFSVLPDKYKTTRKIKDIFSGAKTKATQKAWKKTKQKGFSGLFLSDAIISYMTWLGAEAKGRNVYKKLPKAEQRKMSMKEFSQNYADDIVVQCQGSAARAARAPIQRTAEGKFITTLGTFTIANFDFITRHLMGIKNPDITKPQALANAMRFVIASTIISSIFDDGVGLQSPIPTPVRAFQESLEQDDKLSSAVQAAATELLEFIPVYGGKYKFDSELLGPVTQQLVKLGKGDYSSLGRLGGLPGFQQLWKAYRAEKRGGTATDMVLGRYLELPKEASRARAGRGRKD